MSTTAHTDPQTAQTIAGVIRDQITPGVLMSLGAHGFVALTEECGGLAFQASILPFTAAGVRSQRPARMNVRVILTLDDTYDVRVLHVRAGATQVHYEATEVYADQLPRVLFALDYNGPTVLNPRY